MYTDINKYILRIIIFSSLCLINCSSISKLPSYIQNGESTKFQEFVNNSKIPIDLNKPIASFGRTPLMLAIQNNNEELVKFLISKEVDLNVTDSFGSTSLHYATEYYKSSVILEI